MMQLFSIAQGSELAGDTALGGGERALRQTAERQLTRDIVGAFETQDRSSSLCKTLGDVRDVVEEF